MIPCCSKLLQCMGPEVALLSCFEFFSFHIFSAITKLNRLALWARKMVMNE
jgi:hypothetical protein